MSDTSDPIDAGSLADEQDRERAIAAVRARANAPVVPLPTHCDNECGELCAERSRWCSKECMEEQGLRQRQRQRQGQR